MAKHSYTRNFTEDEDKFLKDNYLVIPTKRMSLMLGRNESSARQRMKRLGITVPADIIAKFRANSQIKKGATPPNKGKKQSEYMSKEAIEKCKPTQFKKGQKPHNTRAADGEFSDRKDKTGKVYRHIRVSIGKWVLYHSYLWEKKYGKIPKGHCLWFKDGNSMNITLDNLELITRAENVRRNSVHRYTPEMKQAFRLIKKINKTIKSYGYDK